MNQEIVSFLAAALECSVYTAPREPGLTTDELVEIAARAGYQKGEVLDTLPRVTTMYFGQKYLLPDTATCSSWVFLSPEDPDFRNFDAFDFVVAELNAISRSEGAANAILTRSVVVERAVARGISRQDMEVAITYQVLAEMLAEKDGLLRFSHPGVRALPSDQLRSGPRHIYPKPWRKRAYPFVKDVVERRSDGRPKYAEPFDAFTDQLEALRYGQFRLWWMQTVSELRQTDPNVAPVSASVLAAALVEGALTFIVSHARSLGLGVFQSKDFDKDSRTWKIDDLLTSAVTGGQSAVLSNQIKNRADGLVKTRQRIHAGRMLSEFPGGPPDLRPEEAREAKAIAEQVVRSVIDWLVQHPPAN